MRIVSLLPSATEIVCALGQSDSLVGRSEECDYPPAVRRLPVVMRAVALDQDRPSATIDARVQQSLREHRSLYELDLARLAELSPDVILTQDLCRVCSVTDAEVSAACSTAEVHPRIVSVSPTRLADVWGSIETIGEAIGVLGRATDLVRGLPREDAASNSAGGRSRVAVLEWLEPPIPAGLWVPDMVRAAGGTYVGPAPGSHGGRQTWETVLQVRPDLVVLSPCSFSVERTRSELERSPARTVLDDTEIPLGVWLADEAYFSRPGPRLANGIELLRSLLRGARPVSAMPVERWPTPLTGAAS